MGSDYAMKITNATIQEVQKFLEETFQPEGSLYDAAGKPPDHRSDMEHYAKLAKFLSDEEEVARAAGRLAGLLGGFALSLNQHCQNDVSDPFLEVLRNLGVFYGFNTDCYTLDNQVSTEAFHWVVSQKSFFHDAFTRPHGEYTHAVQWLLMAIRFASSSPLLPVADLYARSVAYISKEDRKFITGQDGKAKRIYLWNFLVDCFDGPDENFKANIRCRTYRCPQYVTNRLVGLSPESWLGRLLIRLRHRGLDDGEPPTSPRYARKGRNKGKIFYTLGEKAKNLDDPQRPSWKPTLYPNVYTIVPPTILIH